MPNIKHTFGQVRAIPANVEETRTIEFVISSNTRDRHGSILPVDKWNLDNFNRNGIVGYQHNVYGGDLCNAPDPDQVIGTGRAWIEGDVVIGEVKFEPASINPLAEKIFQKVRFGSLKATSVGFNPTAPTIYGEGDQARGAANETEYYQGQELMEFSIVNIPSNPDALKRSMRDQAANAISYLYRQFEGKHRFADIENMTVRNVIDLLENKPPIPEREAVEGELVSETDESHSDQTIDQMNSDAQRDLELETLNLELQNRDNDLILLAQSKLALKAIL